MLHIANIIQDDAATTCSQVGHAGDYDPREKGKVIKMVSTALQKRAKLKRKKPKMARQMKLFSCVLLCNMTFYKHLWLERSKWLSQEGIVVRMLLVRRVACYPTSVKGRGRRCGAWR
jgi:hypothetical protein